MTVPDLAPTIALATGAVVYAGGVRAAWRRAGRGRAVRTSQVCSFTMGMLIVAVALLSPLDDMAEQLFAAHMTQHVLLAVVAPPFLVAGAPTLAGLWLLPLPSRRAVMRSIMDRRWLVALWRRATMPAVACAIHAVVFWVWHLPRLYTYALEHDTAHALEHMSFVGSAMLLWWGILHPRAARSTGPLTGILALFATMMQSGALGAIMTLSRHAWYPVHAAGVAAWGTTLLADQQLAGLIMWVAGGLLYIVAMSILFMTWMQRRSRSRGALSPALLGVATVVASSACAAPHQAPVSVGDAERGRLAIIGSGCGGCHAIGGIRGANGRVGARLDGIATRTLIAGELPNTPENMTRWLVNPPAVEPTTAMPILGLTDSVARDIAAYLYTLR